MNETLDTELEFTTSRIFDAPRESVFKAWTDPELMRQWAAPHGFAITYQAGELRPDGVWRTCMRSPEGVDLWLGGSYVEIIPPQRLVFTHVWDEEGGQPAHETLVTVTFEEVGGRALLTLHQQGFRSRESRDGHEAGWNECLDILAELLANR